MLFVLSAGFGAVWEFSRYVISKSVWLVLVFGAGLVGDFQGKLFQNLFGKAVYGAGLVGNVQCMLFQKRFWFGDFVA